MAVEILIDGEPLDTPNESWLSLNAYPPSLVNGYVQIAYSNAVILKRTVKNLRLLKFPNVFDKLDKQSNYQGIRAVLNFNGMLFECVVYLESIGDDYVKIQINFGDFQYLEALKTKDLEDIEGKGSSYMVPWNEASFQNGEAWTATPYVFPFIDYGNFASTFEQNKMCKSFYFPPAVKLSHLFEDIFHDIGYSIVFYDAESIENYLVVCKSDLTIEPDNAFDEVSRDPSLRLQEPSTNGSIAYSPWTNFNEPVVLPEGNAGAGEYEVSWDLNLWSSNPSNAREYGIEIRYINTIIDRAEFPSRGNAPNSATWQNWKGSVKVKTGLVPQGGGRFQMRIFIRNYSVQNVWIETGSYITNNRPGSFKVKKVSSLEIPFNPRSKTIDIRKNLPNITQWELLMTYCQLEGLFVKVDNVSKKVFFTKTDFEAKPKDLSGRIKNFDLRFFIEGLAIENKVTFEGGDEIEEENRLYKAVQNSRIVPKEGTLLAIKKQAYNYTSDPGGGAAYTAFDNKDKDCSTTTGLFYMGNTGLIIGKAEFKEPSELNNPIVDFNYTGTAYNYRSLRPIVIKPATPASVIKDNYWQMAPAFAFPVELRGEISLTPKEINELMNNPLVGLSEYNGTFIVRSIENFNDSGICDIHLTKID